MNKNKIERLKAQGWEIGNTSDFLNLSREEMAFIDLKIALSKRLKELRLSQNISQESLAKKIKSSQSRNEKNFRKQIVQEKQILISTQVIMETDSTFEEAMKLGQQWRKSQS